MNYILAVQLKEIGTKIVKSQMTSNIYILMFINNLVNIVA